MSKAYCLLNHALTANQLTELREKFFAAEIIYPPKELALLWSEIPTVSELTVGHVAPFVEWLSGAESGTVVVLQGEAGATFMLIDYCLQRRFVPVHAVTKRIARETRNGETIHRDYIFEHVCFRRYFYYRDFN
ncbi:MAG: hypothetical protein LBT05_00210 [Planctomycetaceae bacterium]|jgi:hypothetical protein|nr:hypothetical protein [Planctomycetaceae bacterium]